MGVNRYLAKLCLVGAFFFGTQAEARFVMGLELDGLFTRLDFPSGSLLSETGFGGMGRLEVEWGKRSKKSFGAFGGMQSLPYADPSGGASLSTSVTEFGARFVYWGNRVELGLMGGLSGVTAADTSGSTVSPVVIASPFAGGTLAWFFSRGRKGLGLGLDVTLRYALGGTNSGVTHDGALYYQGGVFADLGSKLRWRLRFHYTGGSLTANAAAQSWTALGASVQLRFGLTGRSRGRR